MKTMNIAIALDGTAWAYPAFFGELMRALQARGHKVGILTSHHDSLMQADLRLFAARGFPAPDFYYAKKADEAGLPVAVWKPEMMRRHSIAWLFDDLDAGEIRLLTTEQAT